MDEASCLDFLGQFHTKVSTRTGGRHHRVMHDLFRRFEIDPKAFDIIQITGSCGKGSTAAFISAMLQAQGIRHGLFTGPHLFRYEERFAIDGQFIETGAFIEIVNDIAEKTETMDLTDVGHKHLMTLIAMMWFSKKQVPLVIFENGAGGWSDPSNVFDPAIACLTELTLDHTQLLGDSIEAITKDKSAIIKPTTQFAVCGMYNEEARRFLLDKEKSSDTRYDFLNRDYALFEANGRLTFKNYHFELSDVTLGLEGRHQRQNAANAIQVIQCLGELGYPVAPQAMKKGLENVRFPGRLEKLAREGTEWILDGAHNPLEMTVLSENLKQLSVNPNVVVISFASKKDVEKMLLGLHLTDAFYFAVPSPFAARQQPQSEVEAVFRRLKLPFQYCSSVEEALHKAEVLNDHRGPILVTGSLYLVGNARQWLLIGQRL